MNAAAFSTLIAAFNELNIRYSVVGSVASSAHGIVRGTLDTDLLALIVPLQAARLASALGRERAVVVSFPFPEGAVEARVSTAEYILLAKLRRYALGGQVSERQWGDITGILAINRSLDFDYMKLWAGRLGVSPLLERAVADAKD